MLVVFLVFVYLVGCFLTILVWAISCRCNGTTITKYCQSDSNHPPILFFTSLIWPIVWAFALCILLIIGIGKLFIYMSEQITNFTIAFLHKKKQTILEAIKKD